MSCNSCNKNAGINLSNVIIGGTRELIHGAIGIGQSVLHINRVDDELIAKRRDFCRNCEFSTKDKEQINLPTKGLNGRSKCIKCKCFIALKTTNEKEHCPINKW